MAQADQTQEIEQEIDVSVEESSEDQVESSEDTPDAPNTPDAPAKAQSDELTDYSKSVQQRIKKLTEKYRNEERDRQEAVRMAQQLMEENNKLKARVQQLDTGYLDQFGARVEAQVASARKAYKDAYEANDADALVAAQEALARAVSDQDKFKLAKERADRETVTRQKEASKPQPAPAPAPQPRAQEPDPKAAAWAEKNSWFGTDEVMTYAAFGLHRRLVEEEGFDPTSDEYYTEIERRIRAEFPQKFQPPKKPGSVNQVAPADSSASRNVKQERGSVKLTPSEVAMAKRLNVPLAEYAKYVKR